MLANQHRTPLLDGQTSLDASDEIGRYIFGALLVFGFDQNYEAGRADFLDNSVPPPVVPEPAELDEAYIAFPMMPPHEAENLWSWPKIPPSEEEAPCEEHGGKNQPNEGNRSLTSPHPTRTHTFAIKSSTTGPSSDTTMSKSGLE